MNLKTQRKITTLLLASALLLIAAGCATGKTPEAQKGGAPAPLAQPAAALQQQPPTTATVEGPNSDRSYSDTFEIRFDGDIPWTYQLKTRNANGLREINMHIEGISDKDNPGDIRLVTDGVTTWMTGQGTDQACIQFPSHEGMDPTFIVPETLFPYQSAQSLLSAAAEEEISGKKSVHYSGSGLPQGAWTNATVDVWQDQATGGLVRFSMQAAGDDPFFGSGAGTLSASYEAMDYVEGNIEPVQDCGIEAPLPKKVELFVRLPEMASFESPTPPNEIVSFYQNGLSQAGWAEAEPLTEDAGKIHMSYTSGDQEIEIQITPRDDGGSKVKLLFTKTN